MEEFLFPAEPLPFSDAIGTRILPYAQSPFTQRDVAAVFDSSVEFENPTADSIWVRLQNNASIVCPITSITITSSVVSPGVLVVGDSLSVNFWALSPAVRVQICGRYHDNPGIDNGTPGQYTFVHTVRQTDYSGPCSVSLYLTSEDDGVLPVYTEDTGFSIVIGVSSIGSHCVLMMRVW